MQNELESALHRLLGKACWSMIGPSAGSWFSLDFGERRKKEPPILNDKLRPEQREFGGEFSLFVQMSGWRLFQGSTLLCDCNSSNTPDGPMAAGLQQLEGRTPLQFELGKSAAKLALKFSDDYRLQLSDWEGVDPRDFAYFLRSGEIRFAVAMDGKIVRQELKRASP